METTQSPSTSIEILKQARRDINSLRTPFTQFELSVKSYSSFYNNLSSVFTENKSISCADTNKYQAGVLGKINWGGIHFIITEQPEQEKDFIVRLCPIEINSYNL